MTYEPNREFRERVTRAGEVLLSHNHIALLHGLMDRPDGIALSVSDWMAASLPYARRYRPYVSAGMLEKSIRTMHPSWIHRHKAGRCIHATLLSRGRAIIDRQVAARIRRYGAYAGLPRRGPTFPPFDL